MASNHPIERDILTNTPDTNNPRPRAFTSYRRPSTAETQSTVIIGAGIIGCATAYYLSRSGDTRPDTIHLVESSEELFASASGKAGGFLAEDWFGPATASLGELSFRLHRDLAEESDGGKEWGYARSTGTSLVDGRGGGGSGEDWLGEGGSRADAAGMHEYTSEDTGPAWLRRRKGDVVESLSEEGGVAQVDPLRLSQFLLRQCIRAGVRLHYPAKAMKVARDHSGALSGLRIRHASGAELKIPCTRLLITAGAWTPKVFEQLFPHATIRIPVSPLAGHSVVVRSPRWTKEHEAEGCHAIFTTMRSGFNPEIFSRVGEEIYIAGLNSSNIPLPETPGEAKIDPKAIEELTAISQQLLGKNGTDVSDLQIVREGLCFRPVTRNGNPILAKIPDAKLGGIHTDGGVYVCAGHGPWGITHSLGSGKCMAETMEGKPTSADIRRLGLS